MDAGHIFEPLYVAGLEPATCENCVDVHAELSLPAEPVTKEEMNAFAEGSFFNPLNIGLDRKFQAPQSGTLLLRLNLPCKDFLKNKGAVQVEIAAER